MANRGLNQEKESPVGQALRLVLLAVITSATFILGLAITVVAITD